MEDIKSNRVKRQYVRSCADCGQEFVVYLIGSTLMVWKGNVVVILAGMIDSLSEYIRKTEGKKPGTSSRSPLVTCMKASFCIGE